MVRVYNEEFTLATAGKFTAAGGSAGDSFVNLLSFPHFAIKHAPAKGNFNLTSLHSISRVAQAEV